MSNLIEVSLPLSSDAPFRVRSVSYRQQHFEHDYARIKIRDWGTTPIHVKVGTPIKLMIQDKELVGYVHETRNVQDAKQHATEIVMIGASYVMRQSSQEMYVNMTADQIIKKIAIKYGFSYKVVPHPRVFPHVAQAGMTDWELMVRLAKQCGYFLRAENTSIYFYPMLQDFNDLIGECIGFKKNDAGFRNPQGIYSFRPVIGETLTSHGNDKSAISVAGVDAATGMPFKYTAQTRPATTRLLSQPELFDKHATNVVATSYSAAVHEANTSLERGKFPYIAEAELTGTSQLRPGLPIHFDGVGDEYSGYWTILKVVHEITEPELNKLLLVTNVEVGSDSLGAPSDSSTPTVPSATAVRTIRPDIKNTIRKPKNIIKNPTIAVKPITKTSLVNRVNRANLTSPTVSMAVWVSDIGDLGPVKSESYMDPVALRKVQSLNARR